MKSPFPGMDPYIEACGLWEDFHNHLIDDIYRSVAPRLPQGYTADTAVRSYVVVMGAQGKKESLAKPDVSVTHPPSEKKRRKKGSVATAEPAVANEPTLMQAFVAEEFEESFVEIYLEGEERILVTCIEVLSPSNKRRSTKGWKEYRRKRQAMLLGQANFIEIDLLRGGNKMPMRTPWPSSPYTLLVCSALDAPYCRVWKGHYRDPLPSIPVPLLEPEPDLTLDLQPLIDSIYTIGRYNERIDYTRALTPPWPPTDAVSVRRLLKEHAPQPSRRSGRRS